MDTINDTYRIDIYFSYWFFNIHIIYKNVRGKSNRITLNVAENILVGTAPTIGKFN